MLAVTAAAFKERNSGYLKSNRLKWPILDISVKIGISF